MGYELDDRGLRVYGYNQPIRFYDDDRVLQAEIFLEDDNQLNLGGLVSGGGGTSGTATMTEHDIGGSLHTGILNPTQAPQFLLLSGTREMTGDLDMGGNAITDVGNVDGVDVSGHASRHESGGADAVDHDSLTGFVSNEHINHTSVTLTAGNGLTGGGTIAASRSFAVGAGDGVDVAADSIAVDVTDIIDTAYGLTENANDIRINAGLGLDFDAGALVHDTGDLGDLHTNYAEHDQNETITSPWIFSDDLTVDNSNKLLYVDVSAQNVGILCDPDDQFALDVSGAIRGTYLVGSHAIQLDDAVMICHFDAARPYATDFTVGTTGHLGQVAVASNVIGRPGKFGKAVEIGESTTNLIVNPVGGDGTTGWVDTAYYTLSTSSDEVRYGEQAFKLSKTSAGRCYMRSGKITVSASTAYTMSTEVFVPDDADAGFTGIELRFLVYDSGDSIIQNIDEVFTITRGEWTRISKTLTMDASASYMKYQIEDDEAAVGDDWYYDGIQVEQSAYPTPFTYGDMPNSSWSGTAHESTSTRSDGSLYYTNPLDATEGTLGVWWQPFANYDDQPTSYLFDEGSLAAFFDSADYKINFTDGTNTAESSALDFSAGDWVHLVFTWSSSGLTIYIDGVADGTNGTYTAPTLGGSLYIGSDNDPISYQPGLLDDLFITSSAMGATEVRAIYESDAPVFAETSISVWRSPTSVPIWVDEQGLWAEDADGNAVYGVNVGSDSHSWGGITMDIGDIVTGHNQTDSAAMWWDQSEGQIKFLGDGSATVQAYVDTDGSIKAGGGYVKLDSSGVTLYTQPMLLYSPKISFSDGSTECAYIQYKLDAFFDINRLTIATTNTSDCYESPELVLEGHTRIHGGASTYPQLRVDGEVRISDGLYVGGTGTEADADDIWCDGEISTDGGTTKWNLGDFSSGAPTPDGYVTVTIGGTSYKLAAEEIT